MKGSLMHLNIIILFLYCIGTSSWHNIGGVQGFIPASFTQRSNRNPLVSFSPQKKPTKVFSKKGENKTPSTQMKGQVIPDKFEWVPILKISELARGDKIPFTQDGQQLLLVVESKSGEIFCTAQASPFLSYPLSQGRTEGNAIVCPQSQTKFDLETGKIMDQWCPFPPFLGPLVFGKLVPPRDLAVFPTRAKNGKIEVYLNRNFQSQFESQYWKGLLDAQGKATGDYY